jgi:CubicO group peptidase (beta-lactamase class C family)
MNSLPHIDTLSYINSLAYINSLHYLRLFIIASLFCFPGTAVSQPMSDLTVQLQVGRIGFSNRAIGVDTLEKVRFVDRYHLTNTSNLFIGVTLAKPLAVSLQELAPGISKDSLAKIGNDQFNFYIDHKLVYQTNLLPGAPTAAQQQSQTHWTKPLIDNQHEGAWWSQSAWNRFMRNGGEGALTEGNHLLRMELRPYVKLEGIKVGAVIAAGELSMLVNLKPVVNVNAVSLTAIKPYNDIAVSKEKFDHDKIKVLKANIEANVFKHVTSIVVLKNGKLLIEEYFNGAQRDSLHDVRSVGKSFASTLTGIAIDDGYLQSEQQQLKDFYKLQPFKNYSRTKDSVRLKDLLTMSSTFDGDDDDPQSPGNEENMYPTDNWLDFALNLPLNPSKYHGQWHYFTTGVVLLGQVLHEKVPGGLEKYADAKLFKPLGINNYQWQYTPQYVVSTAGGIRMNSLDFAKYGQLYKNRGKWKGMQLVPEKWVDKSLTRQLPVTGRNDEYYGYLFWNKTYHSQNKAYETFYCSGNGGNKIYILKDEPLVVVITATAYGTTYAHTQADKIMEQYILPAVYNK